MPYCLVSNKRYWGPGDVFGLCFFWLYPKAWLARSLFPNQGLNLGHSSESAKS